MDYDSWKAYNNSHGRFVKIAKKGIKPGDIFYNGDHVWMYAGGGCLVEANEFGWKANSIRVAKGTNIGAATGVIRYAPR